MARRLTAKHFWIAIVPCNALTHRPVVGGIAERILAANRAHTRIFARFRAQIAVPPVVTLIVVFALRSLAADTLAPARQPVTALDRTDATASLVDDQTTFQGAHAPARFVDLQTILFTARLTVVVLRQSVPWRTRALTVHIADKSTIRRTESHLVTLNGRVALVSRQTLADHRAHRQRVEHLADRVNTAR
uniref:Putative secreted protein n=1 Tax=Anopheles marajoara TaxID=58244 RepID=A0A2M4C5V3_9DIPT